MDDTENGSHLGYGSVLRIDSLVLQVLPYGTTPIVLVEGAL